MAHKTTARVFGNKQRQRVGTKKASQVRPESVVVWWYGGKLLARWLSKSLVTPWGGMMSMTTGLKVWLNDPLHTQPT